MKNKVFLAGMFGIFLAFVFGLTGCPQEAGDNTDHKAIRITVIPEGTSIAGVSVFSQLDEEAVAVGINTTGTETASMALLSPAGKATWKGSGKYYVMLTVIPAATYFYTDGAEATSIESLKKLDFNQASTELKFEKFKPFSLSE